MALVGARAIATPGALLGQAFEPARALKVAVTPEERNTNTARPTVNLAVYEDFARPRPCAVVPGKATIFQRFSYI